jgi:hypothetical protein
MNRFVVVVFFVEIRSEKINGVLVTWQYVMVLNGITLQADFQHTRGGVYIKERNTETHTHMKTRQATINSFQNQTTHPMNNNME